MTSVLVPIGNHPFFVKPCIKNITETCGVPQKDINIIFLTSKPIDKILQNEFDEAKKEFKFEVKSKEFKEKDKRSGIHLKLLDWAIYSLKLSKWTYVQHCDMFWNDTNWLTDLISETNNDLINISLPYEKYLGEFAFNEYKFSINGNKIIRTHDFGALYNINKLKKHNFSFMWGKIKNLNLSDKLNKLIELKKIKSIHKNKNLTIEDELDGSDLIGLEIQAKFPEKIIVSKKLHATYVHGWDVIGIADDMKQEGITLKINRPFEKSTRGLTTYSWISTFLFKENFEPKFPWKFLIKMNEQNKKISTKETHLIKILKKYCEQKENNTTIEKIEFTNYKLSI